MYDIFPRYPKWVLFHFWDIICQELPETDVVSLYLLTPKGFPTCELLHSPLSTLWHLYSVLPPGPSPCVGEDDVTNFWTSAPCRSLYCWALLFLCLSSRLEHPLMVCHCSFWSSSIVDQVLKLSSGPCPVILHPFCEEKTRTAQTVHHMGQSLICTQCSSFVWPLFLSY